MGVRVTNQMASRLHLTIDDRLALATFLYSPHDHVGVLDLNTSQVSYVYGMMNRVMFFS